MRRVVFVVLGLLPLPWFVSAATPSEEAIRVHVVVDDELTVEGVAKADLADLRDSAEDLRREIQKRERLVLAENEEAADIVIHVRDRWDQTKPNRNGRVGYALRYRLVAGPYVQEDDYVYGRLSTPGGQRPRRDLNAPSLTPHVEAPIPGEGRSLHGDVLTSWTELAENLSKTLERFARENYERLIAERTQRD